MRELRGGCLCGAVQYTVTDSFKYAGYCHCSECRRFSGSAFSAFGGVSIPDFHLVKGAEAITHYKKSENTILAFCRICGSSLYGEKPNIRSWGQRRRGTTSRTSCRGLKPGGLQQSELRPNNAFQPRTRAARECAAERGR
jgi:hypothetical protein